MTLATMFENFMDSMVFSLAMIPAFVAGVALVFIVEKATK